MKVVKRSRNENIHSSQKAVLWNAIFKLEHVRRLALIAPAPSRRGANLHLEDRSGNGISIRRVSQALCIDSIFRLLELGGGNRPVESGAQLLGCLQRQLNPSPCPGFEGNVDEVERDDVAQRRMARVVIGNHRPREREPFVPALCHALCPCDLDNGRAHVRASYFARCLPKKANTLLQPSMACSGR